MCIIVFETSDFLNSERSQPTNALFTFHFLKFKQKLPKKKPGINNLTNGVTLKLNNINILRPTSLFLFIY